MRKIKKKIAWDSYEYRFDVLKNVIRKIEGDDDETEYVDEDGDIEVEETLMKNATTLMHSPLGVFKLNDSMNPFKNYRFWMADTNFDVSPKVLKTLKEIPGIEVLKIVSRYRFFIGIGRLFEFSEVREDINKYLLDDPITDKVDSIKNKQVEEKVNNLIEELKSTGDNWAIYVFPNGNLIYSTSKDEDFEFITNNFRQAVNMSSGVLIGSDNNEDKTTQSVSTE